MAKDLLPMIDAPKIRRLVLFIPATSPGMGFQQWYYKFCMGFGMKGVFNFGEVGEMYPVEQKEDIKKDRNKARRMLIT